MKNRFYEKIEMIPFHDCWEWVGGTRCGYGAFWLNGRMHRAHRVSYQIHFGDIPTGLHVLHKCDNTTCVRPDHLFLGDHKKNMEDKKSKGRAKGVFRPYKETPKNFVKKAVAMISAGKTISEVARKFGVHRSTVRSWSRTHKY